MTNASPIHFGWVLPPGARRWEDRTQWDAGIRRALDAIGGHFDSVWMTDHFQWDQEDCLESLTTIAHYAALYPHFDWGTVVLCQSYRNPAYLAKVAGTLQFLTRGRFILGIGAGWKEDEHRAYGYPFPRDAARIDQLEEAVTILRWMGSQPAGATFDGQHYHIHNAINQPAWPKPPTLMIGGAGEKRMLPLIARHADWWNVNCAEDEFARKVEVLRRECDRIGRDFATLRLTWFGGVAVGNTAADVQRRIREDDFVRDHGLVGSPEHVAARLQRFIDLGCTAFLLYPRGIAEPDEIELLIELTRRWR